MRFAAQHHPPSAGLFPAEGDINERDQSEWIADLCLIAL